MCGICGILNFDPNQPVRASLLQAMTGTMIHRGPDDEGYFLEKNVALGHRRLAIIDLSGGKQPVFNEEGSAVIVFNGEMYNYADLTRALKICGHRFSTRSDTETIVHAYDEFGEDCVHHLRGMFAFALWDRRRRRLLLVRDRLGIKPLYYYMDRNFLAFASEIKALLKIPEITCEVDPQALDLYLSLRYVPGPGTMFRNILKLQPGHLLVADPDGCRIRKYWDLEYGRPQPHGSWMEYQEQFMDLLQESVRLHLAAEVPLGVFLSGGLDSSSVLGVMSKMAGNGRVKTFSVGYMTSNPEEEESNEFHYSRLAARHFGADHHEFVLQVADFRDFLPELVWYLEEPVADAASIPLFFISRLARRHITVVLSGEGGDEVLAGYGIYKRLLGLQPFSLYGRRFSRLAAHAYPWLPGEALRHYLSMLDRPLAGRYRGVSRAFLPETKTRLLGKPHSVDLLDSVFAPYFRCVEGASALDQMLYVDTKLWLPDDLLLKADKMTMANSLELRVPFLDHKLVEFAARLPAPMKLRRRTGKFILREGMKGVLPRAILERPKQGFPVPTACWLRRQLKDFTREILLAPDSACRLYMDPSTLSRMAHEHEQGSVDRNQELWTLLVFEFWHRVFMDRRMGCWSG